MHQFNQSGQSRSKTIRSLGDRRKPIADFLNSFDRIEWHKNKNYLNGFFDTEFLLYNITLFDKVNAHLICRIAPTATQLW